MKFKLLALALAAASVLCFAGCGSSANESSDSSAQADESSIAESSAEESSTEEASAAETIPAGDFTVSGDGTMYLSTAGGTTEDGNVPVVSASSDTQIKQIGINAHGYDGTMMAYIYIDGSFADKQQLSDSQTTLDLSGESLTEGVHKVEVVQYTGDTVSADNVATYQTMQYEIKY
jgi:hypothetical protein|nr:MAG TPA: protein of unknown function (DUF4969) [Caudoviricetes sp.]